MTALTAANAARLAAALDREYRFSTGVTTLRAWIAAASSIEKTESNGLIDWSRTHFNRLDARGQRDYEARLKAKRYFYVNGLQVPKIVWDSL